MVAAKKKLSGSKSATQADLAVLAGQQTLRIDKLELRIDKFEKKVDLRFNKVEARLDTLEQQMKAVIRLLEENNRLLKNLQDLPAPSSPRLRSPSRVARLERTVFPSH